MCTAVKFRNGVKGDDRGEVRYVSKRVCIIPVMHIAKKITKTDLNEGGKEMHKSEYYCDHCGKRLDERRDHVETAVGFEGDMMEADLCKECAAPEKIISEFIRYEDGAHF